jgi:hypothetical protein
MKDRINELKEAFCNAKSDKQRADIDMQMQALIKENPDAFAESMTEAASETSERATQLALKHKLQDVIPAISLVYIAKTYFNKTDAWLYQRINGNIVNGKPAAFTSKEMDTMKFALNDLSKRLGTLSVSL